MNIAIQAISIKKSQVSGLEDTWLKVYFHKKKSAGKFVLIFQPISKQISIIEPICSWLKYYNS